MLATGEIDELAHIRYDIPNTDGTIGNEYWSATHTPLLDEQGEVALILQHTVNITTLGQAPRAGEEAGVVRRGLSGQGASELEYRPSGLYCCIVVSL